MSNARPKEKQDYCPWCGRYKYLLADEGVCGGCSEDPGYLEVIYHNRRVDSLNAKRRARRNTGAE